MRHRQPLQELLKHIIGERKYFWKIKLSKYTTCTKKTRQIWVNSTLNPGLQQCQLFSEFSKVDYTFAACFFQQMSCVPRTTVPDLPSDGCDWKSGTEQTFNLPQIPNSDSREYKRKYQIICKTILAREYYAVQEAYVISPLITSTPSQTKDIWHE